jgi:arylsulfatase A-like enzyme
MIIRSMEEHGVIDNFDIMLVSDHGHATVEPHGKLDGILEQARMALGEAMPRITHTSNNVYGMPNEAPPTAQDLAPLISWFQAQSWVGALLGGTDEISALPGMLSLRDVWNGTYGDRAPLFAISGAWSDDVNDHGVPGSVRLPTKPGGPPYASHGNLSPYELHAFAAFSGPGFHEDRDIETPTGSTDLLPTIMSLLGLPIPEGLDGRVLAETLVGHDSTPEVVTREITPQTPHPDGFEPVLKMWQVGNTSYIDHCVNSRAWS